MEPFETPMSFEDWKQSGAFKLNDKLVDFMKRNYDEDYKAQWEEMLKNEYQHYLMDFNNNWLL